MLWGSWRAILPVLTTPNPCLMARTRKKSKMTGGLILAAVGLAGAWFSAPILEQLSKVGVNKA